MPVDNLSLQSSVTPGWNMFVAAMIPNQDLRTNLISKVYNHTNDAVLPDTSLGLGAMYAPLALKVPVKLTANPTTTGTSSKLQTNLAARGTIRGVLGGVAALLVILVITLVVWRRRRRSHRCTSVGPSSLEEITSQGTQVMVTPFNPTGSTITEVAPLDAGPQTDSQKRFFHLSSSSEDLPLPLGRVASVPVGLSSKELARLRSMTIGSRSQPMDGLPSNPSLTATTDRVALGGAAAAATSSSSEARMLRSEVNVLRHEIHRLQEEIFESPPSYASVTARDSFFRRICVHVIMTRKVISVAIFSTFFASNRTTAILTLLQIFLGYSPPIYI
ncbi:hypothetical protein BJY52DRAFT_1309780 [Lactarius psammicola]|nr:hypothetical protein BJY52DRAFT_1309780 [Lactarius psammicola]